MKTKRVIACMSDLAKGWLFSKMQQEQLSDKEAEMVHRLVQEVPECSDGSLLQVKDIGERQVKGRKRAPSEYNIFLGKCMKTGKNMKACVREWKTAKT